MLAVMAVIALAFAGVAVFTEMNANDADAAHAPVAFAYGYNSSAVYEGMKVLAYDDNAILVDTTDMDLNDETMFYVGLSANSPTVVTAEENRIGPIAAQNGQLWINGTGFLTATKHTAVALYAYSNAAAPLGTADIEYTDTAAALDLKTNYHKDATATPKKWTNVNYQATEEIPYEAYTDAQPIVRFGAVELDQNTDTSADKKFYGVNYGYGLNGWALSFADDAATNPIVIQPTASIAIEDVIFAMADGYDAISTDHKALTNPIGGVTANKITLYAIWGELIFSLEVGDAANVAAGTTTGTFVFTGFGTDDVAVASKVIASVTSKVTKDSFALLRIQQTAASEYTYSYDVYYGEKSSDGTTAWKKDTDGQYATVKMISNGVFKVSNVKADIKIALTVTAASAPATTAYAFNVDQINNTSNGFVNLSLDLFDYVAKDQAYAAGDPATPQIKSQIAIDGTYFTTIGDSANAIRVYGNLRTLGEDDVTEAGYIDLAAAAASQIVDYQYDATHTSDNKALQLTATDSVFDLSYQLGSGMSIYAAQGVWNEVTSEDGSTVSDVTPVAKTPWALYKA